jgi:SAM-dependent methyltransferase
MAITTVERYRQYWADKSGPLARASTPEFYKLMAEEIRLLWNGSAPKRVLELGCGTGEMFPYFGFEKSGYKGVDFMPHFIEQFRARHAGVSLECCDASAYVDNSKYDLLFSNELIQHFDEEMLSSHFRNARTMMHESSYFICAGTPWRTHHAGFLNGSLVHGKRKVVDSVKNRIREFLGKDPMGRWYEFSDIREMAKKHGMSASFYGSLSYLYRFHAVMHIRQD